MDARSSLPKNSKSRRSSSTGLKTIAIVEAVKGGVVLLAAAGAISLIHENAQELLDEIARHFHLNPARHYPGIFIDVLSSLNSTRLWLLAVGAFVYASMRFIEAYGLWHDRAWAEWFGVVSGAIYIPLEIYELAVGVTAIKVALLAINLLVVGFLVRTLHRGRVRVSAYERI